MEIINYQGWQTCYRLHNQQIDLIVTADVGPRIIRLGFIGADNEFYEDTALHGKTGGAQWVNYGGHRLWHAPEAEPRTYAPDNEPVDVKKDGDWVRFIQPVEPLTGIQKEIALKLDPTSAHVSVIHRLRNTNHWSIELAPWALSVMAAGGKAIIPQPPRLAHDDCLQPINSMALWAYTDMQDRRWNWGTRYVTLQQEAGNENPQKVGLAVPDGWVAYARNQHLFVKTFTPQPGKRYPDFGSHVEVFTNDVMLEVETLGPLTQLAPQACVEYAEQWHLFKDIPAPQDAEDITAHISPKVALILQK